MIFRKPSQNLAGRIGAQTNLYCSEEDWVVGLREQLAAAVRRWCMSDVPIGVFIVRGMDSAAITGLMARPATNQCKHFPWAS